MESTWDEVDLGHGNLGHDLNDSDTARNFEASRDPDTTPNFEGSRDPDTARSIIGVSRDSDTSRGSRGFSQILAQPLGGEEPEPDYEPFSQSGDPCTQGRTKSRSENADIGEIPVEVFRIPPSASTVPGLKPTRSKSVGASGRRKVKDHKARSSHKPQVSLTTGEIDALGKLYASPYALDVDELPVRMPKLPFASRLAVDVNEGSHFPDDGGYQRWLDYSPLASAPKEGEEGRTVRDKRSRSAPQSRIASREKKNPRSQEIGADLYPMGLETRLPPFPQALKIPNTSKHRQLDALKQERLMSSPVVHVADVSEDDDADSWVHEIDDASRTIMCGNTCRLDNLVPLAGFTTSRSNEAPTQSSDLAMAGLSEFVGKADDKVLSYILEQGTRSEPQLPQVEKTPSRLAPGMPLPGQVPGFPLQL